MYLIKAGPESLHLLSEREGSLLCKDRIVGFYDTVKNNLNFTNLIVGHGFLFQKEEQEGEREREREREMISKV